MSADRLSLSSPLLDRGGVSVVRLNGRPRDAGTGRHRRAIIYVAADVEVPEAIRLLRTAAEDLAKTLPRSPE